MLAWALAAIAIAAGPTPVGHVVNTSGPDLQLAFQAAFGSTNVVVRKVNDPVGRHPTSMVLRPEALIELEAGTYVLVVLERNEAGFHFEPGAVSVAYLSLAKTGWTVNHLYPEFIWTGNEGEPADAVSLVATSGGPILAISREYVGQGQHSTTGWLIRLSARAPTFLGSIPLGGMLEKDSCTECLLYNYASNLGSPSDGASILSAHYIGWKETVLGERFVIDEVVQYAPAEGGMKATHDPDLPG